MFPTNVDTLFEPFAGSAALTLAAADRELASRYVISDKLRAVTGIWQGVLDSPLELAEEYRKIWEGQHEDPRAHFLHIRDEFNQSGNPAQFLYLAARCVKNAVRFNPKGEFNQSADHRRRGTNPIRMKKAILGASEILAGKAIADCIDYREVLIQSKPNDFVYMDPPYQGVSSGRDKRYAEQLDTNAFYEALHEANQRDIRYAVSFDGSCGGKVYGSPPPSNLHLSQISINAGRSSQATLNGGSAVTIESLYLSPALADELGKTKKVLSVS